MKNVHLITTDKPIYITSDEEIKEGDWFLPISGIGWKLNIPIKANTYGHNNDHCKKIILTTDQDLIKDGVQPIEAQSQPSCLGAVMRSASEVFLRLEEAEKELAYHQEWYKKARENYDRDRKFWGQADDGEMRVASDAASVSQREVTILKWVLGHQ
jgi:hypothetical protein